ncbi:NDUA2 dehydrogenase, partial [Zapornia atra]|nr:NDUA2 dehydrogenase [Zapornia atra]
KMAAAAVRGIGGGLGRSLRELRIHLCQRSAGSRGVSEEPAPQSHPSVFPAEFGKEKSVPLNNLSVDEVAKALESLVKAK